MESGEIQIYPQVQKNAHAIQPEASSGDVDIAVEYPDAFGNGTHLQYAVISTGLKENIVLESYDGTHVFSFRLETGKLVPERTEGKWIRFVDPTTGAAVFTISESFAQDSYTGEYDDTARHITYDNYYTIEQEAEGVYLLQMVIDRAFLEDPKTVYPVTVDPTYTNASTAISGLYDANITDPQSYDNDFSGLYFTVRAGDQLAYIKNYGVQNYRHINPATIYDVRYQLCQVPQTAPACTISLDIPWNVHNIHTVTYDTLYNDIHNYSYDTKSLAAVETQDYTIYSFNITDAFRNWMQYVLGEGGYTYDVGFILRATSGARIFASTDHSAASNRPQVTVYYREGGTVEDGIYRIRSRRTSNVVSVFGSPASGTNVTTAANNHNAAQRWKIEQQSNGLYRIRSMANINCYLGLSSASDNNGINICLTTTPYSWRIIQNSNASYRIMPNVSYVRGMNIDFSEGIDHKNVILWKYEGGSNEQWYFDLNKDIFENPNSQGISYNGTLAANYANLYADWTDPSGELDTPGYLNIEANCTNFVSQCLVNGGMQQINNGGRESNSSWYYDTLLGQYAGSYTWGAADHFVLHWGHNPEGNGQQRAYKTIIYPTLQAAYEDWEYIFQELYLGDVLQTFTATQGVHHSMIVCYKTQTVIKFAQHTGSAPTRSLFIYLLEHSNDTYEGLILHNMT